MIEKVAMKLFGDADAPPRQVLQYLRDCYQAHGYGGELLDLFHSKITHRLFHRGREPFLAKGRPIDSVRRSKYQAFADAASLKQREMSLLYAVFPVVGRADASSGEEEGEDAPSSEKPGRRGRRLCAPLFTFPASLSAEDGFPHSLLALRVDLGEPSVNIRALSLLLGEEGRAGEVGDALLAALPALPWTQESLGPLLEALGEALPALDLSPLAAFPEMVGGADVRAATRQAGRAGAAPRCLSAAALVLAPQAYATRGVLHELGALAEADSLSPPLRALLGRAAADGAAAEAAGPAQEASRRKGRGRKGRRGKGADDAAPAMPAVLSTPQRGALAAARSQTVSQVIGPPGTGKSFTLAALALEHVSRGESVLIASRTNTALEVIAGKVEELYGSREILMRGGRSQYLHELKNRLESLLHEGDTTVPTQAREKAVRRLADVEARVREAEDILARRGEEEIAWGRGLEVEARGWQWSWRHLARLLLHRRRTARLGAIAPYSALLANYEALLDERVRLAREVLQLRTTVARRSVLTSWRRPELKRFLRGLRAQQSGRQDKIFSEVDLGIVLGALPLWLVSFSDIHRVLPLVPELFSLVVVDEATQCDPASGLPVVQRGSRLLVSGDPRQLRHVSFLARGRQRAMAERRGLSAEQERAFDYRETSLLDLAGEAVERAEQTVLLDEHFRSTPRLIGFSNREMYGDRLRVMTRRPEAEESRSLLLRRVEGTRLAEGHNPEEARRLIEELRAQIDRGRGRGASPWRSIGVLSPFRGQVEHLSAVIPPAVGLAAVTRHAITVGTPYAFQGEERDVMLLSLAVDAGSHPAAFRYLERSDVFNVAITRARSLQVVFCSLSPEELAGKVSPDSLLARYLAYVESEDEQRAAARDERAAAAAPSRDRFAREVREALQKRGFRTWESYRVAGFPIDLVVERGGSSLGIDLIGGPGAFADVLELERYRMLRRAGLPLVPVTFFAWHRDALGCLEEIERALGTEVPDGPTEEGAA